MKVSISAICLNSIIYMFSQSSINKKNSVLNETYEVKFWVVLVRFLLTFVDLFSNKGDWPCFFFFLRQMFRVVWLNSCLKKSPWIQSNLGFVQTVIHNKLMQDQGIITYTLYGWFLGRCSKGLAPLPRHPKRIFLAGGQWHRDLSFIVATR